MITRTEAAATALEWAEAADRHLRTRQADWHEQAYQHALMWTGIAALLPEDPTDEEMLDVCGHQGAPGDPCQPCSLPLGHELHRDGDGCSWPDQIGPVLDRTAIRNVVLFVASATGHPRLENVDALTDRLWDKHTGQAEVGPTVCPDLPGHETHSPPCGFTSLPLLVRPTPPPCSTAHDCPGQPRPEPLTARGEARCQSQHRPDGGALVQCAQAVHGRDLPHTDFDPDEPPTLDGPGDLTRRVWRDQSS